MGNKNTPFLPNLEPLYAAGINPKTGLPIKFGPTKATLKEDIKKALRIIDEQDAVNRYVWHNVGCLNLTSQELERFIYYKGQLCFFYLKDLDEFFITPYALDGTIDFYGRFNSVHPVPYAQGTEDEGNTAKSEYLTKLHLKCVYDVPIEVSDDMRENCCVLLHDYTKQLSQTCIPRVAINDPILDVMADFIPFMRTNALLSSGVKGVRVNDADQQTNVLEAVRSLENSALTGKAWLPIIGSVEFQELGDGSVGKGEDFMLAMQSIDNFRLSTYGIDNGGLFEKTSHILEREADINGGPVGLVLNDGLLIRQHFCNVINAIWGLGIWCEVNPGIAQSNVETVNNDNGYQEEGGQDDTNI